MRELMLAGEPYITDASLEADQAAARVAMDAYNAARTPEDQDGCSRSSWAASARRPSCALRCTSTTAGT